MLPSKIKILGHTYSITIRPNILSKDGEAILEGLSECFSQKIHIDEGLAEENRVQVLIHEVLHCIDYHMMLGKLFSDSERESKIEALAHGIFSILMENDFICLSQEEPQKKEN